MNISSINNTPNIGFEGKILTVGSGWNRNIKRAFVEHPEIQKLSTSEKDVVGRLFSKKASNYDSNHYKGEPIYRFDLMVGKSKKAFINKILGYLNLLPKISIVHDYHCEEGLIVRMKNRLNSSVIKKNFN